MAEALRNIDVPEQHKSRKAAAEFFRASLEGDIEYRPSDIEILQNIKSILDSDQLRGAVSEGYVTLGIIKPRTNEGLGLPQDDEEASRIILDEIGEDRILFKFSVQLNKEQTEKFYAPNKDRQSRVVLDEEKGTTIWDTVMEYTPSAPLTFLLIFDPDENAVTWWREKMGATNPGNAAEGTIRRKHATTLMLPNNLVHGSDSIESALREISVLSDIIGDQISTIQAVKVD